MARNRACIIALIVALSHIAIAQAPDYDRYFTTSTMRVDYVHAGGPGGEHLTIDRVADDGPWAGSRTSLIDETNLGTYRFEIRGRDSDRPIYSKGFGSVYGEWSTTPEARSVNRSFQESIRFPWPKSAIVVTLKHRDAGNLFQDLWSTAIDPASPAIAHANLKPAGRIWSVFGGGRPTNKVDVLLMSEGYTAGQLPKFHKDAARLVNELFSYEPFKARKASFNIRALDLPSERASVHAEFNIFGLERYVLANDNRALRDAAAAAGPYDVVEILVNSAEYGGGGIFNAQGTAAVDNPRARYVFVHEFAHNFAGLGDEYTGNVTYQTSAAGRPEPWEPNLTALHNPSLLKWRDLVEPGTPVPTPDTFAGKVGAFEGGGYQPHGIYRPEFECIMGTTRDGIGFCRVCQRAISRMIDTYTQ